MTDNDLPILADGLFDGGLAADVAPKDLRAAVDVLRIAQQAGSVTELAQMADKVQMFSAEVTAGAPAVSIRSTAQTATTTFLTHDTTRSTPMFATRITRKAFTIVAITLLAAGTAAAAAGGALPMFVDEEPAVIVDNGGSGKLDAAEDVNDPTESEDSTDVETTMPPTSDAVVENNIGGVDVHGKCTAWTSGATKDATNPSFAELQVAADAAGVTIDEYCATFVATADDSDDESDDTEESADDAKQSDDDESADDDRKSDDHKGNSGNGNSGNGNSDDDDNGSENHGNSGNGNSHDDDDDDDNSGNGNSGNGNSGNGNSGNGNSGHGNGSGNGNSGKDKSKD